MPASPLPISQTADSTAGRAFLARVQALSDPETTSVTVLASALEQATGSEAARRTWVPVIVACRKRCD